MTADIQMRLSFFTSSQSILLCFLLSCIQIKNITSSSSSPKKQTSLHQPDRWVSASPLAITALCKDGFAFLAAHTAVAQEPLLLPQCDEKDEKNFSQISEKVEKDSHEAEKEQKMRYASLPPSFCGPFRIERLDGEGSCLVSAGWRTDCSLLAEKCRSLIASEVSLYGEGVKDHGRVLAESTALWMAQCAFSNNVSFRADICACSII